MRQKNKLEDNAVIKAKNTMENVGYILCPIRIHNMKRRSMKAENNEWQAHRASRL